MNLKNPEIYAGAKKNEDGTLDKSRAAIISDPGGKIAEKFDEQTRKEEGEKKEGFDWEIQLKVRHAELYNKKSRQGLSEHGELELERLTKAINALREG
jgi:hypothetical protein